jgi:pimeloyl-ACP methyl ester carboxylesterase
LRASFPDCVFHRFEWKGGNSVAARVKAAERLAGELRGLHANEQQANHFIIAHSHGGNIACYTLQDHPELQQQIAGVICLSTPFLHVQKRKVTPLDPEHLIIFITAGLITFWLPMYLLVPEEVLWLYSGLFLFLVGWLALAGYGGQACIIYERMMKLTSPLTQFFIVRVAADEASAALILLQVSIWLMNKAVILVLFPLLSFKWLMRGTGRLVKSVAEASLESAFGLFLNLLLAPLGLLFVPVLLILAVLLLITVPILVVLLSIPLAIGMVMTALIVGVKLAAAHIYLDLSVEPAPPGSHTICQFSFRGNVEERIKAILNHSIVYQSPEIATAIITWIRKTAP